MKKDGTIYLALAEFENESQRWEIVSWKIPAGLSDPKLKKGWCNQTGFKLKVKRFIEYYKFDMILQLAYDATNRPTYIEME